MKTRVKIAQVTDVVVKVVALDDQQALIGIAIMSGTTEIGRQHVVVKDGHSAGIRRSKGPAPSAAAAWEQVAVETPNGYANLRRALTGKGTVTQAAERFCLAAGLMEA